jgi:hypothetical protein
VGIFWAVRGPKRKVHLLEHRCALTNAEPYGQMLTCAHGHYDIWEQWRKDAKSVPASIQSLVMLSEYEEWPRGRVVYSTFSERFLLYADAQILQRPDLLSAIRGAFELPEDGTDVKPDDHYRSSRRLE